MTSKVTIIVLAFNEERHISLCLRALLSQNTDISYEVIVVDDGSLDSTPQIVHELKSDYTNLRLIRHGQNLGRGAARRTGQNAAESTWIGYVDADILVPMYWLKRCIEELSNADGVSGIAQPDGDCAVIWRICHPTIRLRKGSAAITGNNVIFSNEALRQVPFSVEAKLGEDYRLSKLMTMRGFKLHTIDGLIVEHHESKTYAKGLVWMWQSGVDATSLLFDFRTMRLPDFAWLVWSAGILLSGISALMGTIVLWTWAITIVALTFFVNALFIISRFNFRPNPFRFLGALVISPPLIFFYLIGRSAGLLRVRRPLSKT